MPARLRRTMLRRLALAGTLASAAAEANVHYNLTTMQMPVVPAPNRPRGYATLPLPSISKWLPRLRMNAQAQQQTEQAGQGQQQQQQPLKAAKSATWRDRVGALLASGEIRAPKYPVVLCHGLFGFDKRTILPFLVDHYWKDIGVALEHIGCKITVARVPSTGDVRERAHALKAAVESVGAPVNLLAHSMGGLDARYLISHLPPTTYPVLSLTTIATPHRGSHFMDYLRDVLGVGFRYDDPHLRQVLENRAAEIGSRKGSSTDRAGRTKELGRSLDVLEGSSSENPDGEIHRPVEMSPLRAALDAASAEHSESESASTKSANPDGTTPFPSIPPTNNATLRHLLAPLDRPAYHALTTDFCTRVFNPLTPDNPDVAYFSYGAYVRDMPVANLLRFSHGVIKERDGDNDGLVSLHSAKWGEYLGTVEADHWDLNGRWRVKVGRKFDAPLFWANVASTLAARGF